MLTFKQYSSFLEEADRAETPEQLDEVFGKFFGKEPENQQEKAKTAFEKRKADAAEKQKGAEEKKKEAEEQRAALRKKQVDDRAARSAAGGRAAEHDWVNS